MTTQESSLKQLLGRSRRDILDKMAYLSLFGVMMLIVIPFFMIILDVVLKGVPVLSPAFLLEIPSRGGLEGGIYHAITGSVMMVALAVIFAVPISIGGAIFIVEYTPKGRARSIVETSSDILSGVPSIVFGAFGFTFFVSYLNLPISGLVGGLTLSLMMIPTLLRTTQEALLAVPRDLREASLALGATKLRTTFKVTIRASFPAVITGIMLSIGRVIGETAPLLFTAGYSRYPPSQLTDWAGSLPFTIYIYINSIFEVVNAKAYGTALVLLLIVFAIDLGAQYVSQKITQRIT